MTGFNLPQLYEILFHEFCDDIFEEAAAQSGLQQLFLMDAIKDDAQKHAITQLTGNAL